MEFKIDFRKIFDNIFDGVYVVDRNRIIRYWNHAAERLTGYRAEEVIGSSCKDNILIHVSDTGKNLCTSNCPLKAAMAGKVHKEEAIYLSHKDGHRVPIMVRVTPLKNDRGELIGAVEIFNDNTRQSQAKKRLRELEKMALIDSLTDLPNRRHIEAQLESRMTEFHRYGWPFGVLFMDIDHFKQVNDTYGHDFGDRALKMISKTLNMATRSHDLVGRWGGEEFLAIIPNADREVIQKIGERYRVLVMNSHLDHDGRKISFTISGGGAISGPGDTAEKVVERADKNQYQAKNSGRNKMIVL